MKKILLSLAVIMLTFGAAYAQSWKSALKNAAENAVNKHLSKTQEKETTVEEDQDQEAAQAPEVSSARQQNAKPKGMARYNKYDFVAGDQIIFDDQQIGEQIGEFPSMWDLMKGEAEIAQFGNDNIIVLFDGGVIMPLMQEPRNYLGDIFTIEFDYYVNYTTYDTEEHYGSIDFKIFPPEEDYFFSSISFKMDFKNEVNEYDIKYNTLNSFNYYWTSLSNEDKYGDTEIYVEPDSWHHISISFNKRAMKVYLDETRIVNIPNMTANNGWMGIHYSGDSHDRSLYIKNVRIAKGAVPLYDRVMSEGRFITYGIWFDVGRSEIRPESMGEINRIYKMLTDNPDLKFTIEGHTDDTGDSANNLTLSEARARAIADKLIEMGISPDRLNSVGKGQTNPLTDNASPEARAKNRRVEFVKF